MTSRHPEPIVCACLTVFCDIPDLVALTAHLHLLPWISYYKALFQHEAHPTVIFRPQTRGAKTPKTTTWRSSRLLGEIQEDLFILRCRLHTRIKTNTCPAPPFHVYASTKHACGFAFASETCYKSQHAHAENTHAQYDPSAPPLAKA